MSIRLGLQIGNFSYGTGVEHLFPTVIAQAGDAVGLLAGPDAEVGRLLKLLTGG